jgi:hypothetical protein
VVVVGVAVVVVAVVVVAAAVVVGVTESSDLTDVVGLGDVVTGLVVSSVVGGDEFPQAAAKNRKARRTVNFLIGSPY